ncbi:peroxisomal multifunctional enzyme type 2 [Venturia canescens]|uniref:peroxisomal multifunctional enzyme type 2 n=1 Tax=Venturia canescens TaxID=32260 RepID=UPI001C9D34A0|nr:peroxisomal multifunctional enzyme type 2 [Venturia canescens]
MADKIRFDGRVVIVTGAGAGLGRAYALLFASRGASVVVNDLGGGRAGDGSNTKVADAVVNEIRQNGGKAVANYDSVVNGKGIVQTAIDAFGRLDILVNNAGILRDRSFVKMTEADWDIIQDVHVKGAMNTTQAAWGHFRKQRYGRVIFTSSNSGLYGNFGQANYSAAKAALVGLANTLAIEGRSHNIHVNVIVPTAGSRLTEDVMPPDFFQELKPELIAPVVVWLCHEECEESGSIIDSAVGWAAKCHLVRSKGVNFRQNLSTPVTPEAVKSNWAQVTDMSNTHHFGSIQEATGELLNILEQTRSGGSNNEPQHILEHTYNYRDTILYAIGVGAKKSEATDFQYLYENHENFSILPSFFLIYGPMGPMGTNIMENCIPGTSVDLTRVLHGEQYLKVHKALPTEATVVTHYKIDDVLDKTKNALILVNHETFDKKTGDKLTSGQMSVVVRGAGGFKGPRNSSHEIPAVEKPKRKPDATYTEKTSGDQAVIYRLSGDTNPLHIDPNMAVMGGFKEPILHGLCSLGFATRHVLKTFANGNSALFEAIKVRFAQPTIPGETLQTNMWQNGSRIHFETIVAERNVAVITGAYIDLKRVEIQSLQPNKCLAKEHLESDAIFAAISNLPASRNVSLQNRAGGILLYDVTSEGELKRRWSVDVKRGKIYEGLVPGITPENTIRVDDKVIIQAVLGKWNQRQLRQPVSPNVVGNVELLETLKLLNDNCKPKL